MQDDDKSNVFERKHVTPLLAPVKSDQDNLICEQAEHPSEYVELSSTQPIESCDQSEQESAVESSPYPLYERGKATKVLHGHTGVIICLAFSQDGSLLASGCDQGVVNIWHSNVSVQIIMFIFIVRAIDFVPC